MWWSNVPPAPGSKREVRELRKLVASQEAEIQALQRKLREITASHEKEALDAERRLVEAHSTIQVQQLELKQCMAVIERDRARVEAEAAIHATQLATAHILKMQGGQRGSVLKSVADSTGG